MAGRTRSWWGWGNVEDAVAGTELDELVNRVWGMLPQADLSPVAAPRVTELGIAASDLAAPAGLAQLCSGDPADRAALSVVMDRYRWGVFVGASSVARPGLHATRFGATPTHLSLR